MIKPKQEKSSTKLPSTLSLPGICRLTLSQFGKSRATSNSLNKVTASNVDPPTLVGFSLAFDSLEDQHVSN